MSTTTFYYPDENGWDYKTSGGTKYGAVRFLITQETNDSDMTSTVTCVLQVLRSTNTYPHYFDTILQINDDAQIYMSAKSRTGSVEVESNSSNTTANVWSSISASLLTTTVTHGSDGTASMHITFTKSGDGYGILGASVRYNSTVSKTYVTTTSITSAQADAYITLTPISAGGKVQIFDGTDWVSATPYVFDGTEWVEAKAYVFDGSEWQQTSN